MTPKQIKSILEKHKLWLVGKDGACADLIGVNLRGADLSRADLSGANLSGVDLCGANLRRADLSGADLSGADLRSAHLRDVHFNSTKGILYATVCFAGLGAESRQWSAVKIDGEWRCFCGCFTGTLKELGERINAAANTKAYKTRMLAYKQLKAQIAMINKLNA